MDTDAEGRHDLVDAWPPVERSYALHWLAENEPEAFTRMADAVAAMGGEQS